MNLNFMQSLSGALAVGLLGLATLGAAPQVQAADVYWSIGVQSGPAPAVVVPSRPAYPPPRVVYAPPPPPPPMPAVVVVSPGYVVPAARWDDPRGRRDRHHKHHHHWRDRHHGHDNERRVADTTCYHQDVGYLALIRVG